MSLTKQKYFTLSRIVFIGMMAAVVFVVSMFRFPFFGSKLHFGNTMCLLAGLLFGPIPGGIAAGLGSFLVDVTSGYPIWEGVITFVSKFAMGALAGLLGYSLRRHLSKNPLKVAAVIVGSVTGAVSYVFLYLLKHFIMQLFVYGSGWEATFTVLGSKFPASAINAAFAMVCAPLLFFALYPALIRLPFYRTATNSEKPVKPAEEKAEPAEDEAAGEEPPKGQ